MCANMPCVRGNRNVEPVCECVRHVRALTSETVTGPARRVRLMSMRPLPSADWCALAWHCPFRRRDTRREVGTT